MKMTKDDWNEAKKFGFSKSEKWGDPFQMEKELIDNLIVFRKKLREQFPTTKLIIHCGYEKRNTGGYHPKGMAVDLHGTSISLADLYLMAERYGEFGGIGVYFNWNRKGLHLDIGEKGRRWSCYKAGQYGPINKGTLYSLYLDDCFYRL